MILRFLLSIERQFTLSLAFPVGKAAAVAASTAAAPPPTATHLQNAKALTPARTT